MGFSGPVYFGGNPDAGGSPWLTVDVDSVAFSLFGRDIMWYGILIGVGLILAVLYAFRRCRKFGIDSDKMLDVVIVGVIAGIIGARAYYVLFAWDQYKGRSFWDIINISEGGLAIYGGVIFGLLFGYLACRWRKVRPLPMLDLACLGFLIGQGVGRWGNFMNQEAFGSNTSLPWGMYSEGTNRYLTSLVNQGYEADPLAPVHPCFLYESIWCLLGFLLLHIFSKKWKKYDGQIFLLYLLWYGFGRFFIEGLRTDSLMWGPYRISQLLAAACVIGSAILLIVFRKRREIFGEEGLKLQLAEEALLAEEKKAIKAEKAAAKKAKKQGKAVDKDEKDVVSDPSGMLFSDEIEEESTELEQPLDLDEDANQEEDLPDSADGMEQEDSDDGTDD